MSLKPTSLSAVSLANCLVYFVLVVQGLTLGSMLHHHGLNPVKLQATSVTVLYHSSGANTDAYYSSLKNRLITELIFVFGLPKVKSEYMKISINFKLNPNYLLHQTFLTFKQPQLESYISTKPMYFSSKNILNFLSSNNFDGFQFSVFRELLRV